MARQGGGQLTLRRRRRRSVVKASERHRLLTLHFVLKKGRPRQSEKHSGKAARARQQGASRPRFARKASRSKRPPAAAKGARALYAPQATEPRQGKKTGSFFFPTVFRPRGRIPKKTRHFGKGAVSPLPKRNEGVVAALLIFRHLITVAITPPPQPRQTM